MTKPLFQEADEFVALHPESREIIEKLKDQVSAMAALAFDADQQLKAVANSAFGRRWS
jgi:hypothetical protein